MSLNLVRSSARTVLLACVLLAGTFGAAQAPALAAPPSPTSQLVNPPNSVAVLGDSISVATGISVIPSATQPASSWATGTNASVNSVYSRLLAINPAISGNNYNQASNGRRMNDISNQANAMPANTRLVLVQLGGNDLCRDTVAQMPSVSEYRAWFAAGLDAIANRSPNAITMVSSVPDIWNLWFLRGAPNPPNPQPSSRRSGAYLFWDTLAVVPCQSLVTNPGSMDQADIDRRAAVRQRNIDYNQALFEECSARLRCRTDSFVTFEFSSNRNSLWGDILPPAQWEFVDDDISTVDHFHPSLSGQTKLARASWESGWDYTDNQPPTRTSQTITPAPVDGASAPPVTVSTNWTDPAGIKGIEHRVHHPNGGITPWQTSLSTPIPPTESGELYTYPVQYSASTASGLIAQTGVSYVEMRATDGNGNLSASQFTEVNIALGAPSINSAPANPSPVRSATFTFSGAPGGATYQCSLNGGSWQTCVSPRSTPSNLVDGPHNFKVRIVHDSQPGPEAEYAWVVSATVPPAATVTSVPVGLVNTDSATIEFTGSAAGFECSLNQAEFTTCSSPLELTGLPQGANNIRVRQVNDAGLQGPVVTRNWSVDSIAPAAPAVSGAPSGVTNSRSATISFTGESEGYFTCSLDGGPFAICASPHNLNGLPDGTRQFQVRQTDPAGNTGPVGQVSWSIDATAPAAPNLAGAPTGTVRSTAASISITGESGGSFECRLNAGAWSPCSSPWSSNNLSQGAQNFEARQTDAAGNTGPPAAASWSVDTMPPQLRGAPRARARGKARKGRPRAWILTSAFVAAQGRPASLEFSLNARKPSATATPARARTRKWVPRLTLRLRKKPAWVRVVDEIGNWSPWVRVR